MDRLIEQNAQRIDQIARRRGATRVRVFGSRSRGDASPDSDLDLLVDMEPDRSLLDLAGIKVDLEDELGCVVDVVDAGGLNRYLRDIILTQARPIVHDDRIYLYHIRDAADEIAAFTRDGHEKFITDTILQRAVLYTLNIIGEATRKLSPALRDAHPEIPWRDIISTRNIIVHDYVGVDLNVIWRIVSVHLPTLRRQIEILVAEASSNAGENGSHS